MRKVTINLYQPVAECCIYIHIHVTNFNPIPHYYYLNDGFSSKHSKSLLNGYNSRLNRSRFHNVLLVTKYS